MKAIIPTLDENTKQPYYLQLYEHIKGAIVSGEIVPGEKLPSLRNLAKSLKLSVTTIDLAYSQLLVEGYIYSKPSSGFFVGNIATENITSAKHSFARTSDIVESRED
jgi:GntR family transcriptional regulator/MocR family aminotransferase